jgi:hypothetical protein
LWVRIRPGAPIYGGIEDIDHYIWWLFDQSLALKAQLKHNQDNSWIYPGEKMIGLQENFETDPG